MSSPIWNPNFITIFKTFRKWTVLSQMNTVHKWSVSLSKIMRSTTGLYPEPKEYGPQIDCILSLKNAVHNWTVSWAKWIHATLELYPEPKEFIPQLACIVGQINKFIPQLACILGQINKFSPQLDSILSQKNSVHTWILSWAKLIHATLGLYPEPKEFIPQLACIVGQINKLSLQPDRILSQINSVHNWTLSSAKRMQCTPGFYPEPNKFMPHLDSILSQNNLFHN
jgi:hypothetical protein